MSSKKLGRQTVAFANPPAIIGHANVVGKKEGDGPLRDSFDHIEQDDTFGEKTWEKAETTMQKMAFASALDKAGQAASNLDYLFAGDLLNQCIGSAFAARGQDVPFFGLYGACSTMGESLSLLRRAAVPDPPGVRRAEDPHCPVDGDGIGGGDPGQGGPRALYHPHHHR